MVFKPRTYPLYLMFSGLDLGFRYKITQINIYVYEEKSKKIMEKFLEEKTVYTCTYTFVVLGVFKN